MNKQGTLQSSRTVYFIRQTPFVLLTKLAALEVLFLVFYSLFRLPKFLFTELISQDIFFNLTMLSVFFFGVISLSQLLATVFITLSWTNNYYIIRPGSILHRKGIFSLKEETFSLKNVEAFTINQHLIGKIFTFGTIKFYSPVLKQEYYLTDVPNPVQLKEMVEQAVDSARGFASRGDKETIIPLRNMRA